MKQPVLLHIGFHKTGTTFLQDHVFGRVDRGFGWPWTVLSGEAIQHFVLTHPERFDPEQVASEFEAAVDRLEGGTDAVGVLSHEDLCGYPVTARYYGHRVADRLRATFPEARVLIGIREQQSMIRSLWGQYVVQDGEWPLEEFLGTGHEPPGFVPICRLDHFEYHLLIGHYMRLFGRERVRVLPFEWLKRDPLAFEQAVHDFAGTGMTASEARPASNVGLGARTLAIRRRMNRYAKMQPLWGGDYDSLSLGYRAKQRATRILERWIPPAWHEAEDRRIREHIARRLSGAFRDSNRQLQEMIGIDLGELGYEV